MMVFATKLWRLRILPLFYVGERESEGRSDVTILWTWNTIVVILQLRHYHRYQESEFGSYRSIGLQSATCSSALVRYEWELQSKLQPQYLHLIVVSCNSFGGVGRFCSFSTLQARSWEAQLVKRVVKNGYFCDKSTAETNEMSYPTITESN